MAVEYDPRRPRLPKELAETIDRLRGQMPFNAFVVRALEVSLEDVNAGDDPLSVPGPVVPSSPTVVPAGSPRSEPFVCPVASCQWPGARSVADGPCPVHTRNLIPRRS